VKKSLVIVLAACAFLAALALTPPRGPRSLRQFNPEHLADLEVRMWQAYHAKQRVRRFSLLVAMLHEQYRYSWATAASEGFHLTRAMATFRDLRKHDDLVLTDLEAVFTRVKSWTGASFDANAVARAELAWWVARRVPGTNSPEVIGSLIAEEYALLYETSPAVVRTAALLRAQAGAIRDAENAQPDWDRIARLLRQSYRELAAALATSNV
jgi:hypothetical protein